MIPSRTAKPELKRICEECRECRDRGSYLWCRLLKMEVVEDDYCSFGGDIPPQYEDEDMAYEIAKEKRLEGRE